MKTRSNFRQFFFRGLAILLPTVLTIWIVIAAYQFVAVRIANPINVGIRAAVVGLTSWPEPVDENFDNVIDKLNVAQKDAWAQVDDKNKREYGTSYSSTLQIHERRQWMKGQPTIVSLARRDALAQWWNSIRIGNWVVMDAIGLVVAIVLIYTVGILLSGYIGKRLHNRGEELINRLPLIRRVYPSVKQVTDFFVGGDENNPSLKFNRVVAVEYPRRGIWSVGLVTGQTMRDIEDKMGKPCLTVFIPSSPTPFTGYVITVPISDTVELPINIEEALKFAVSLGVLVPDSQQVGPPQNSDTLASDDTDNPNT